MRVFFLLLTFGIMVLLMLVCLRVEYTGVPSLVVGLVGRTATGTGRD